MENASEIALENASEEAASGETASRDGAFEGRAFEAKGVLGTYRTYETFAMMVIGATEAYGMPLQTSCPPRD